MQLFNNLGQKEGGEIQVNTYVISSQSNASITYLTDSGFVVVWESYMQLGFGYEIYGQRFDSTGTNIGDEFLINTFVDNMQFMCDISDLNDGGFIVAWTSFG